MEQEHDKKSKKKKKIATLIFQIQSKWNRATFIETTWFLYEYLNDTAFVQFTFNR